MTRLIGASDLARAQEAVLLGAPLPANVPRAVGESWLRCRDGGIDPDFYAPVDLTDIDEVRATHPLAAAMPVVRSLLVEHAVDEGLVVAVTDASGRLLWVEGAPGSLRRADRIHFTEGASWGEGIAGTSAPALALSLDAAVRVHDHEHWVRRVQPWSCSAAPLHDPTSGELLGALDVTGDSRAASAGALALVRATVAAVEKELLLAALRRGSLDAAEGRSAAATRAGSGPGGAPAGAVLTVLGADAGSLAPVPPVAPGSTTPAPAGSPGLAASPARRLSLRHAELLLLLAAHREGLSAEALAVLLDERDLDPVTVRAEISRLRRIAGDWVATRPYRLTRPLATDVDEVRRLLDAGDVGRALDAYSGPVLPRSDAPGVVMLREQLEDELDDAVESSRDLLLLRRWHRRAWA